MLSYILYGSVALLAAITYHGTISVYVAIMLGILLFQGYDLLKVNQPENDLALNILWIALGSLPIILVNYLPSSKTMAGDTRWLIWYICVEIGLLGLLVYTKIIKTATK